MEKHVHYDTIIAYANGAKIQWYNNGAAVWEDIDYPHFSRTNKYRVKPDAFEEAVNKLRTGDKNYIQSVMYREAVSELMHLYKTLKEGGKLN